MGKQHNRRLFKGYYKRFDGKLVYVVAIMTDVDTGDQNVIFHYGYSAYDRKFHSMSKESFCEKVEVDGEYVDKFTRQPHIRITADHIDNLDNAGFSGPARKHAKDEDLVIYEHRYYRTAKDYTAYAKDICKNYKVDTQRYNLCIEQRRYIGVFDKAEFEMLKEDLIFLNDCLKTVLKPLASYFKERYIDGKSIRKYAEEHGLNRGSVDYMSKKFITAFSKALKERDDADGICRLKK